MEDLISANMRGGSLNLGAIQTGLATLPGAPRRIAGNVQDPNSGCKNNPNAAFSAINYSVPVVQAVTGYGASEMVWHAPGSSAMWAHGGGLLAGLLVNYLAMTRKMFYDSKGLVTGTMYTNQRRSWAQNAGTMCVSGMNVGPIFVGADNLIQSLTAGLVMYFLSNSTKHALVAAGGGAVGGVGLSSYYNRKNSKYP